jgi:DNA-binding CsgD family transcriptional regulator
LDEAQDAYAATGIGDVFPSMRPATPLLIARGALKYARGEVEPALADLLEARSRIDRYQVPNVVALDARLLRIEIYHQLGHVDEARIEAEECVKVARAWGTPGAVGQAVRAKGVITDGPEGVKLLREAASTLAGSRLQLAHARALIDLGAAMRRAGARSDAREPLREGFAIAERLGAEPLAERGRQELAASGVTVRRSGFRDRLTPSEQRIAEMAAAGSTNPQIAQSLFVTVKTVESHLAGAYRKLGISSRRELPAALTRVTV